MAASMWRMNRLWRRMAGVLVVCALLLSNEVICQDDSTTAPEVTPAATVGADAATDAAATDAAAPDTAAPDATAPDAAAPDASAAPTAADAATAGGQDPAASVAPGDNPFPATIITIAIIPDKMDVDASGTTVAPPGINNRIDAAAGVSGGVKLKVPEVKCVGKDDIQESNAVMAVVSTVNCDASKRIIRENPAEWCEGEPCNLEIFQDGSNMLVTSKDANVETLAAALRSESLKDQLGVTSTEIPSSSSGSSVFVGVLVTGLLAAIAITVGYLKCQRRADPKGVRLAEEAYPVDQENQGNTLVSVAPLNPPQETQEKPSENGETPEAPKTEPTPPPTNGHSTAKTADTEL